MQHVPKIGGTRTAGSADHEEVQGGINLEGMGGGCWRAIRPVYVTVPTGKHPPLYPLRRDMREAKTDSDAGLKGAWLCGCDAAAFGSDLRAHSIARGYAGGPTGRGGCQWVIHTLGRLWWHAQG